MKLFSIRLDILAISIFILSCPSGFALDDSTAYGPTNPVTVVAETDSSFADNPTPSSLSNIQKLTKLPGVAVPSESEETETTETAPPHSFNAAGSNAIPTPVDNSPAPTPETPIVEVNNDSDLSPEIVLPAPDTTVKNNSKSSGLFNLQDADILGVINLVSKETGKNFVVDPRVSGKVTLISSKPVPHDQIYQVFLSILGLLGYSAIPADGVVKIVPNMDSTEISAKVATNKSPGQGDEVVVRVLPLENISAMQILSSVRPLLPQWSNVSAYTPGNVLILSGRANNLKRIAALIQEIDKSSNHHIEVVKLHHASANQVANVLNNLQNSARSTGEAPTISIAVDDRTNNIILSGTKSARAKTHLLIAQLDTPNKSGLGNTEVIYLRYLQAKSLAPIISKVAQNMMGKESSPEPTTTPTNNKNPEIASKANLANIQAEPNINALIITAPPAIMQALKAVIARLDIRPAQVLIEGIIAEIEEADLRNLGIQWGTLTSTTELPPPTGQLPTDFPVPGAGNIGFIPNVQIRAVLSVLENITGVNILSTPSVVVLDNKKATIEVGQDIPEQSGSYATTGTTGTVTPFNTVERKRVSLKLDVTPQINLGEAVRMSLQLENDSLRNPENPGINPLINVSKIANHVLVNSGNVLVIGGLISNDMHDVINKVPILGDIPIIGELFTQRSRNFQKRILVVFIKPRILHNAEDGTRITHTKYDALRQTQIDERDSFKQVGQKFPPNVVPLWNNSVELPPPFST